MVGENYPCLGCWVWQYHCCDYLATFLRAGRRRYQEPARFLRSDLDHDYIINIRLSARLPWKRECLPYIRDDIFGIIDINSQDALVMGAPNPPRAASHHVPDDKPSFRIAGDEAAVVFPKFQSVDLGLVAAGVP